jgi:hypothetical protein
MHRRSLAALAAAAFAVAAPFFASAQAGVTVTYTYDSLGRVTQAAYSNGVNIVYAYDAAGNRTSRRITATKMTVINVPPAFIIVIP